MAVEGSALPRRWRLEPLSRTGTVINNGTNSDSVRECVKMWKSHPALVVTPQERPSMLPVKPAERRGHLPHTLT